MNLERAVRARPGMRQASNKLVRQLAFGIVRAVRRWMGRRARALLVRRRPVPHSPGCRHAGDEVCDDWCEGWLRHEARQRGRDERKAARARHRWRIGRAH